MKRNAIAIVGKTRGGNTRNSNVQVAKSQPAKAGRRGRPSKEEDDIDDEEVENTRKAPGKSMVGQKGRVSTDEQEYIVAESNYNFWRGMGKHIAFGTIRTQFTKKNGVTWHAANGERIARFVRFGNIPGMEGEQKYAGYVVATEGNIAQVVKNIETFYKDPIHAENVENGFDIDYGFPAFENTATQARNTVANRGKNNAAGRGGNKGGDNLDTQLTGILSGMSNKKKKQLLEALS